MNKKGIGLNPLIKGIVTIVLFSFFILSFVYYSIDTQNPDSEIFDSKYKLNESMESMNTVVDDFTATSESVRTQLAKDKPTAIDYVFLIFKSAFYIPHTFLSFIFVGTSTVVEMLFPSLGGTGLEKITTIALDVILAVILVTTVLLIIKGIRTGESER